MNEVRWFLFQRRLKDVLAHLCIICSLALLVLNLLDWYNPYMDFVGHAQWLGYVFYACALILGVFHVATA